MAEMGQFIMKLENKNDLEISRIYSILVALCVTTPILVLVGIKILLTTM